MEQSEATELVNSLFNSLGAFLLRYAYRRTGSPVWAEDAVQEAFLALYRDLCAGKTIQDPKAWTIGAVRNQILKQARARRREDLCSPGVLDLVAAEPDRNIALSEFEERCPAGLTILSPREEDVVLLRLQSLKYREIADQLGIGTKSVCTLLTRAIQKLKRASQAPTMQAKVSTSRRKVRDALQ